MFLTGCKTTTPSFYDYQTECLGVEGDGSQTLKAYGKGVNRVDAVEQAKKNAVRDVIFTANFIGSNDCYPKPILLEVNAAEKYQDYFNAFFKDGGEFHHFISMGDERLSTKLFRSRESKNKEQVTYSVVVRIDRPALKEKLIKDGILK